MKQSEDINIFPDQADSNVSSRLSNTACLALFAVVLTGLILRLYFALTTIGTNDVKYWKFFMDYIAENGSVRIYRDIWFYNHPPLMSLILSGFFKLQAYVPNGFPFLMRLPAILADMFSCFLVFKLTSKYFSTDLALKSAILAAMSPVLVFVSGFHGNTDPVFVMLVLSAAYAFLEINSVFFSALLIGLALNVKIVPIITIPAFFFFCRGIREKLTFSFAVFGVAIAGFSYHLAVDFRHVIRNIFFYSGLKGIWGVGQILDYHLSLSSLNSYNQIGKILIFLTITSVAWFLSKNSHSRRPDLNFIDAKDSLERGRRFLAAIGMTFLLFLIFTPGFGVQYLSWLAVPGIFISLRYSFFYNLIAGVFLFSVYTFWSQGFPWYFANSDAIGQWYGLSSFWALCVWLFMLFWAGKFFTHWWQDDSCCQVALKKDL